MTEAEVQKLFTEYPFGKAKQMLVDEIERSGHRCTGNETVFELRALAVEHATMVRSAENSNPGLSDSRLGVKMPSGAADGGGGESHAQPAQSEQGASNAPSGANDGGDGESGRDCNTGTADGNGGGVSKEPDKDVAEKPNEKSAPPKQVPKQSSFLDELDKAARKSIEDRKQKRNAGSGPETTREPSGDGSGEEDKGSPKGRGESPAEGNAADEHPAEKPAEHPAEKPKDEPKGDEQPGDERVDGKNEEEKLENAAKNMMEKAAKYMDEAKKLRDERRRREEEERKKLEQERQKKNRHRMMDEVIHRLKTLHKAFLVGPAGTGKSTLAMCACRELFDIDGTLEDVVKSGKFAQISFSPDTVSADMLGFTDVNGVFHETEIIRVFRDGGVILFDEMDDADASLLVKLNTMLANRVIPIPGKMVVQHPNCYIVGTANTYGKGGNSMYVGRSRLDGATLDRWKMATIRVEYDDALETGIIGRALFSKGLSRCHEIKTATTTIRSLIEQNHWKQICSTRFVIDSCEMMRNGYTLVQVLNTFLLDWEENNAKLVLNAVKDELQRKPTPDLRMSRAYEIASKGDAR